MAVSSSPPDHRPLGRAANNGAAALDAVGRFNADPLDAAGVDGDFVLERRLIEVAVDRAEVGKVGSAPCHGRMAAARGCLARYAAQRSNKCNNDCDLGGVRHTLILENVRKVTLGEANHKL